MRMRPLFHLKRDPVNGCHFAEPFCKITNGNQVAITHYSPFNGGRARTVRSRKKIQIDNRGEYYSNEYDKDPIIDMFLTGNDDIHNEKTDIEDRILTIRIALLLTVASGCVCRTCQRNDAAA